MQMIVLAVLAFVACAAAAPAEQPQKVIQILRSDFEKQPEGAYTFGFESENGIQRAEAGELRTLTDEDQKPREVIVVRGSYAYPGEDGKPVNVQYYADETGYHAEGDSIPKVPATN